jgi:hypothetical protein
MDFHFQDWGLWAALVGASVGTYVCRAIGVLLSGRIHQDSEIFRWLAAVNCAFDFFTSGSISYSPAMDADSDLCAEFWSDDIQPSAPPGSSLIYWHAPHHLLWRLALNPVSFFLVGAPPRSAQYVPLLFVRHHGFDDGNSYHRQLPSYLVICESLAKDSVQPFV